MVNLKFYKKLCFVLLVVAFGNKGYGQVKQVIDETVSSYQGTSYQAYHSVTLAPGFSFSPNATNSSFFVTILGQDCAPDDPNLLSRNAVRTDIIKAAGVTSESQIQTGVNAQTQISYMDGLGRPIQRITQQGSPLQKDMVQFMAYDQYGGQPKQYLPYTATTSDGSLQPNPQAAQQTFYQTGGQQIATDNFPFAVTVYDNSPLGRVLESGAPGADWQPGNHTIKNQFRLNTAADNIMIWTTAGPTNTYYGETQLSVTDGTDENGNHVLSFTNKLGQLVSKKVQANTGYLETIYIYDDVNNLALQVSPEGVKRIYGTSPPAFDATFINTWACSYTYDAKNRLIAKQAPGAAPVYMVYDANNRLVLMQDGRLRNAYGGADKWYAAKYDAANRPIISGLYTYADPGTTGASNREKLQNYLDGLVYNNTTTFAYEQRAANTTYGYSSQAFPAIADADVLSVNYYDDYDFNNDGTPDYQYSNPGQPYAASNTTDNSGFLTGTYKRVIGTPNWIKQIVFYDQFGNAIQKQSNSLINQTGFDITSNAYDIYAGHITQTTQVKASITVANKLTYDLMDRTTQVAMNINGGADQVLAKYEYNELGQLKDKKLHQKANASFLQTVDYRYNIRGWLTGINNSGLTNADGVNAGNDDVFGMTFLYNQADATGLNNTPYYNGKVSAIKWKANDQFSSSTNPVRERSYTFTYDKVDRLTSAVYAANGGTGWNAELNAYNETIGGYDNNGNILSLQRNTQADDNHSAVMIDDLTYHYMNNNASNQLSYISDASGNANGYNGTAGSTSQYSYDTNGNLTSDANKNDVISYNDLNKVSKVAITGGGSVEYTYDASGTRIRKVLYNASHTAVNTYDYLDGFIYTNGTLTSFSTAEGRVLAAGSSFTYEYNIKDHLGNVRVSFQDNGSGVAKIVQENEYYPFGMTMRGVIERTIQNPSANNKQLFNGGSELQDDLGFENSYSTPLREYDPQIGRFNAIDPMVDKYAGCTPYNFAFNDPVGMNDPSGADPDSQFRMMQAAANANAWAYTQMGVKLQRDMDRAIMYAQDQQRNEMTERFNNPFRGDYMYDNAMRTIALQDFLAHYDAANATPTETQWFMYMMSPESYSPIRLANLMAGMPSDANGTYYWKQSVSTSNYNVQIVATKVYVANANQGGDIARAAFDVSFSNRQDGRGVNIEIYFTNPGYKYSSYQWIQTVSSTPTLVPGLHNPHIDGSRRANGTLINYPFYWETTELPGVAQRASANGATSYFGDSPQGQTSFMGEVTLLGISGSGRLTPLGTFSWGYTISNGILSPVAPTYSPTPSVFQQNIINHYNNR